MPAAIDTSRSSLVPPNRTAILMVRIYLIPNCAAIIGRILTYAHMMAQAKSAGQWLVQGVGLCVGAWIIFVLHKAPDNLTEDVRGFDTSPTCHEDRVLTDVPRPPLDRPSLGECVIQSVTVVNKTYELRLGRGSGRGSVYTITILLPWGDRHSFNLRGDKQAYDRIEVDRPVNALIYGKRVAFLAVNGRSISTTDDPDVNHFVQVLRWLGTGLLLAGGLFSFYRAAEECC
jgi:hypothetical protein